MFAAITATFLAVVDQSNSCKLIGLFGSIAVVRYDFVLCNRPMFNSQCKVATLHAKVRRTFVVLIVSHNLLAISCKKYKSMFEFVKVTAIIQSVFFSGHGV